MPDRFIPYGRQVIDDGDIAAVVGVLRGDWLTTGPMVGRFEEAIASFLDVPHAVAVSSGTAALHLCMLAAGIGPGDEVIVPALTFAASANCARYVGAKVVFADVRPDTLTVDTAHAASLVTSRTRAIVAVDYAGLPCDLAELMALAERHRLVLVEDACHALGAEYRGRKVGSIAHLSTFSFHPVKHLTTAEGGMVTTADAALAERIRRLRNHGVASDHRRREEAGTWCYDMMELGYNYRISDMQCALGLSQLSRLQESLQHRRTVAERYQQSLAQVGNLRLPLEPGKCRHAWHLYPVRVMAEDPATSRQRIFASLRGAGIGVNVHYLPIYLHSYYRSLGYSAGLCPTAEHAYMGLLSLPMWHGLCEGDQQRVIDNLIAAVRQHV